MIVLILPILNRQGLFQADPKAWLSTDGNECADTIFGPHPFIRKKSVDDVLSINKLLALQERV